MHRLRGLGAISALLLVIVGAPLALVWWGRYVDIAAWRFDDGSAVLAGLTLIGWLAWGAFSVATAAEGAAMITGRDLRVPGLASMQLIAGGLLIAAIALIPGRGPSSASQPSAPLSSTVAVAPSAAEPSAPVPEATVPAEHTATTSPAAVADYVVAPGDDLWSIAERHLGDGRAWRQVAALNPSLTDPLVELPAGTRLALPSTADALAAKHPHTKTITVHRGDNLSKLAASYLGSPHKWPRIMAANPQISNPDHIEVGWRLHIPSQHADPEAEATAEAPAAKPVPRHVRADVDAVTPEPASNPSATADAPPAEDDTSAPSAAQNADHGGLTAPLTVGTLAAAALVGSLELRRALRLRERPPGHRLPAASPGADRLRTTLRAAERPDMLTALVRALQHVGRHCHEHGLALPEISTIRVASDAIHFEWQDDAADLPFGFTGTPRHWIAPAAPPLPTTDHPCPYPALVSLGTVEEDEVLLIDAERSRVLGVAGATAQRDDALAAMAIELACAPWSAEARVVVCGEGARLVALAGDDRVQVAGRDVALVKLRQVAERRARALADRSLGELRVDPERADAVAGYVFCFLNGLDAEPLDEIEQLLGGQPLGIAVITATEATDQADWLVGGSATRPEGRLAGHPGSLAAHAISAEARGLLSELLTDAEPEPAPWWGEGNVYQLPTREGDEVEVVRIVEPAVHPRLLLLGPVELQGATGSEPQRSRQQLVELCGWLLEHPGCTANEMASGLAIAESTRRSNLSRLRAWLGDDPDGDPYLPDAYSGRISLHPAVTSDWQQLQILLGPGITRVADGTLIAALQAVRGAPLADAAPGQWYWAEELRTEITAVLRDVGVVLTERALRANDLDLARWAASRALVVAPEDELLVAARLRTEHQAGNRADVERLVNQLTRQARILGVDLLPETVALCQQAVEGRRRAQA